MTFRTSRRRPRCGSTTSRSVTSASITLGHRRHSRRKVDDAASRQSVDLPANAVATLEQTTLLGEKFVAIGPRRPTSRRRAARPRTATVIDRPASELPSVEEVFGLLSQVLNGGDLGDLQTINVEVSQGACRPRVRGARSAAPS